MLSITVPAQHLCWWLVGRRCLLYILHELNYVSVLVSRLTYLLIRPIRIVWQGLVTTLCIVWWKCLGTDLQVIRVLRLW